MHHKKKRPINRRAGCKLCRPWKINGVPTKNPEGERFSDHRRRFTYSPTDPDSAQNWRHTPSRLS